MKTMDCDHCGDRIVIPEDGETVTDGETPADHMTRTGHPHKRQPRLTACHHCGIAWYYTGSADRATCPGCEGKVEPGSVPDEVDDAWIRADIKSHQ